MIDSRATLVNGVPGAQVSAFDRGLHYGDGLFETLRCEQGRVRWFDRHLARLGAGCMRLGIAMPDAALLRSEVEAAVAEAGMERALVKIIVTRGESRRRGYRPGGDERVTRIVSAYPWPGPIGAEFRVGLSPVTLGSNPQLAGIKHLNRLEQVLAQRAAAAAGLHEVLMRSERGEVVCGSMSNVYLWQERELLTPGLADCGVAGIVRALVLELAPRLGLAVRTGRVSVAQLADARAIIVSNVRLGLQPVHWYEGRPLEVDVRGARLQELIDGTH
ncbi:MAG: aminodeoxychorismate lyase [Gammaproteobacteria bacterium]|nr:aminodeoxychorismate lyase [Gammaproteobacteria bacterium]